MGIAAPVKLTALCRKSNPHLLCLLLVLDTYAHSSCPLFNFFLLCLPKFEYFSDICFTLGVLLTHLLEVSAEPNRCTYSGSCTHGTHSLPPSARLSPTHPRLLPLYTSPICGGNYVPPSHPGAATRTQQNHIHPSVHLHPSCF